MGAGGSEAPKRATPARRAGDGAGVGQGRVSPRAPYSPSRASPARRRPSPSLGPAGGGGGGPETLTPTRNPPARELLGVRGPGESGNSPPSPSGAPGSCQRPTTSGAATTSAARAPFLGLRGHEVATAPSWPLRGTPGSCPGKNALSQESRSSTGRLGRGVRRARERGWAGRREIITATLMELLL